MKKAVLKAKKIVRYIDRYSPYPLFYSWVMTKGEKHAFDKFVRGSKEYLEFGAGGSTIRSLQKNRGQIYSVESSLEWIQFLRKYLIIRLFEKKRLTFFNVDIGATKEWGFPVDDSPTDSFPKYSSNIFGDIDPQKLDVIFIDGRFRVACTLSTIIHTYSVGSASKIILIHDFWNREHYHVVLNYLEVIEKIDTLGIFKMKGNIQLDKLKQDYEKFKFDPR